jgi:hypothetical protein
MNRQIKVIMIKRRIILKLKKPIMTEKINKQFQKLLNKYNTKYFRNLNHLKKAKAQKIRHHIRTLIKFNKLKKKFRLKIKLMINQL